jgi:hypothetical protein
VPVVSERLTVSDDTLAVHLKLRGHREFKGDARSAAQSVDDIGQAGDKAARNLDKTSRSSGRTRKGLLLLSRAAAVGAVALGGGLLFAAKESVAAFEESRQVVGQTGAVLKSTGGAANVTARDVDRLTASLMAKTAIDDEQIRMGANMLLTFKQVRNETGKNNKIFDQATGIAVDLSAAFGKDVRSSAILVGKALNDPIKGLTALNRVGITFSEQQKDQITAMIESGNVMGAQKVIMAELASQVKGQAAAQATPLKRLGIAYGELSESAGALLAPAVDDAARAATGFLTEMQNGTGAGGEFVDTLTGIWEETKPVVVWIGKAGKEVGEFVGEHPELAKFAVAMIAVTGAVKLLKFGSAITGVTGLLKGLGRLSKTRAGQAAADNVIDGLRPVGSRAKGVLDKVKSVFGRSLGTAGTVGGQAAADGIVTTTGSPSNRGRYSKVGSKVGKWVGRGVGLGIIAGLVLMGPDIYNKMEEVIDPDFGAARSPEDHEREFGARPGEYTPGQQRRNQAGKQPTPNRKRAKGSAKAGASASTTKMQPLRLPGGSADGTLASAIDRLPAAVAAALAGTEVRMDGKTVGRLITRDIENEAARR